MTDDSNAPDAMEEIGGTDIDSAALDRHWQTLRLGPAEAVGEAREALFLHFMSYAKAVAARLFAGRHRNDVEFDDFLQLANIGLIEAIGRFDPSRETQFTTFCTPRLRGAVLNGIQKLTEAQEQLSFDRRRRAERVESLRGMREEKRQIQSVKSLAAGLAIGFMLEGTGMFLGSETLSCSYGEGYESTAWRQTGIRLRAAVGELPTNERKVISLHYFDALPFEQIATLLDLSKGRISQLHRAGLERLRSALHPDIAMQITG